MSSKLDKLKQATGGTFTDLYVDNKPQEVKQEVKEVKETKKVEQPKEKVSVEKPKPIVEHKEEKKESPKQMLSFRIPTNVIEDIDKYAYVERMNKQDVIIMALEKFFNSKDSKEVLSQYDEIKK